MTAGAQRIPMVAGVLLFAVVYSLTVAEQNADPTWSYFVFTQQWPMAACIEGNATKHLCQIPENVTTWTIHGIWPSDPSQHEGPVNCNSSWKFDERQILTLENQLKKYWPNLYTGPPSEYSEFWEHEWTKHGTCSTNLPATASEFLYFSQGLLLNDKFNLTSLFSQYNIIPGNSYKLSFYEEVITDALGHPPNIQCVMDKTSGEEEKVYIYQIEICLDKGFNVIQCPHQGTLYFKSMASTQRYSSIETGICSAHKEIQYLTIQH